MKSIHKHVVSKLLVATAAVAAFAFGGMAHAGKIYISGQDSDDSGHVTVAFGAQLLSFINTGNTNGGLNILILGGDTGGTSRGNINAWNTGGITLTQAADAAAIGAVNLSAFAGILIPSAVTQTGGGISQAELDAINLRSADIATFVNGGGNLLAFTEAGLTGAFGWFPLGALSITNASYGAVAQTPALAAAGFTATNAELAGDLFHNVFTGPAGFFGLSVLATNSVAGATFGQAAILGGGTTTQICSTPPCGTEIPEPGMLSLFGAGLLGMLAISRRRQRQ